MKTILTKHDNGDYEFRNCKGETWHIIRMPTVDRWGAMFIYNRKLISSNPDFAMGGRKVAKIPNFLKTIIYSINKKNNIF